LALIMGNADYAELSDLQNTHADARAYRDAFQELGFDPLFLPDLDLDATWQALDWFHPGDQVVFVCSGHGWSIGTVNYVVPVDAARQSSDRDRVRASIALHNGYDGILDQIEATGAGLTFAIIDACRNIPFDPPPGRKSSAMSRGMMTMVTPPGTFVVFSAGVRQEALDGLPDDPPGQSLSVFSRTFVPRLRRGMYLEDAIADAPLDGVGACRASAAPAGGRAIMGAGHGTRPHKGEK
jgi:hypothetical protein